MKRIWNFIVDLINAALPAAAHWQFWDESCG